MALSQKEHNDKVVQQLTENPNLIKDQDWRLSHLYFLVTKDGDKQVFKMNRAQKHFYDNYINIPKAYHRHVILKSRQLGFTTFIDLFILDSILFQPNKDAIVIAHKVEDATSIFDKKIEYALRNMADDVKGAFFKINHRSARKVQVVIDYGPETGSTSSITVGVSGRSGTYHYVHISEFAKLCVAYPKRAEEVERGTFPTVPFDGFIFIESTAEGMAGRFYEMFQQNWLTREKITPQISQVNFLPHFYNWQYDDMEMKKIEDNIPVKDMDECEIDWGSYQLEHKLTDKEITYYYMKWLQFGGKNSPDAMKSLMQEYPTTEEEAFLSTGQTYFPTAKVAQCLQTAEKGVKGELGYDEKGDGVLFNQVSVGSLEVFKKPEVGMKYVIGGDTAEGLAHGDAQVLYVINCKTEECDAIYKSQVPPDELAIEAYKLGKYYNWALMGVEVNKDGLWVNDALDKMGYINLYYRKSFDDITKKMTKFFGWKTSSATRPFQLAALKAIFFRKDTGFPVALLNEMFTFVRNMKGKPEAMDKKNDDCFVKDTMILTNKGNIKIQDIKVGDLVITRNGYRPVEFTRSRYKNVIRKLNLTGTPTHKVITVDGEKELDSICDCDKIHIWNIKKQKIEKLPYTTVRNIIDTQWQKHDNIGCIFGNMTNGNQHQLHFIGKFGLIILEKYQKVLSYITRMKTPSIIQLRIWKKRLEANMQKTICKSQREENYPAKQLKSKELGCMKQERSGEKHQRGLRLIKKILSPHYLKLKELSLVVFVKIFLNLVFIMLNIVLLPVVTFIQILKLGLRRKVYNLQVSDTHEYFANGILVSNCIMAAAIGYAILQEQGPYVDNSGGDGEFSHLRAMFGEPQEGNNQISH